MYVTSQWLLSDVCSRYNLSANNFFSWTVWPQLLIRRKLVTPLLWNCFSPQDFIFLGKISLKHFYTIFSSARWSFSDLRAIFVSLTCFWTIGKRERWKFSGRQTDRFPVKSLFSCKACTIKKSIMLTFAKMSLFRVDERGDGSSKQFVCWRGRWKSWFMY